MDGAYNGTFRHFKGVRPKHTEATAQHRRRGITGQPRPAPYAENQPSFFATIPLHLIQQLYKVEAQAREDKLTPDQRKELRLEKSLPLINSLGKWLVQQLKDHHILPKSPLGKAFRYTMDRWDQLSAYLYDGILEIDNNLIENAIRPLALGRKNYLFACSHDAAQRAAIINSFFAICKKHEVNPYEWLKYVLENIHTINHKNIRNLYPQNYKQK